MDNVTISGIEYELVPRKKGNRAVVVVDRGWIFAGDVTRKDGRIELSRAVWVFRWEEIGFDGVLKDPGNEKAKLRKLEQNVEIPADSEVFSIPVHDNWGL